MDDVLIRWSMRGLRAAKGNRCGSGTTARSIIQGGGAWWDLMLVLCYSAHTLHINLTWAEFTLVDILDGIAIGANRKLIVKNRYWGAWAFCQLPEYFSVYILQLNFANGQPLVFFSREHRMYQRSYEIRKAAPHTNS
jgi:hypothetical protein